MKQTLAKGRNADQKVAAPATRKPILKNPDQKQTKTPTKRRKDVAIEKKTPKNADMVTLSKSEFDAILETIGKLAMDSENHTAAKIGSQATENHKSVERNNRFNSEEREQSFMSNTNDNHHQQNLPLETENPVAGIPKAHLTLAERKRLEWQQENDSVAAGWYNRNEGQRAMSDPRPTRDQRQAYNNTRSEQLNVHNTPLFLTAAEKKKLQWEKERAELSGLEKYDPWGRAGGGAPIKDQYGNVVNDYTKRREVLLNSRNQSWTETVSGFKAVDLTVYPLRDPPLQKSRSQPDRIDAVVSGAPVPNVAMMSSFRSGAVASEDSRFLSEKERLKQEWLEDLEKQREEQRQRKLAEKKEHREESPERYYWAERSGFTQRLDERQRHPPQPVGHEPHGATRWHDPSAQGQMELDLNESKNRISAPVVKGQSSANGPSQNPYNNEGNSTFLHGQNSFVDPITRQEQEEKRRKYLETQEFNRRQVEERKQQRREEKEQRIREDLEEEMKFNQTKQTTNPTSAALPKLVMKDATPKDKEEMERQREETLRQALEAARQEAEREKKQRLIEKLRKGNHDVSQLEAKLSSRRNVADVANTTHRPFQEPSRHPNTGVPVHVEPQYVPGLGDMPHSGPSQLDSYRNNYKDVPANFTQTMRVHEEKPSREFDIREASRESTPVEYRMPEPKSDHGNTTKKVRVVSVPQHDHKNQRQGGAISSKTSKQNQGQRPMWGYRNTENKKPIKQSDRDAFHSTQKRLQRRIDRQNELLDMVARNADRVPDYRAPMLSRARSRSRENCAEETKAPHENNRAGKNTSQRNRSQSHSPKPAANGTNRSPRAVNGTNRSPRAPSPPLPSIRHRVDATREVDKYRDLPSGVGASQTNFVPFIRSSNVLNPSHAESPLPMSREPTEMEKARKAYQSVLNPAKYGQRMEPHFQTGKAGDAGLDPLLNPSLVTNHPTHRQGQILQQLSTLRQALKEKQREMNSIPETVPDRYGGRKIISPVYD